MTVSMQFDECENDALLRCLDTKSTKGRDREAMCARKIV
eukprot:COSAG01_NODE_1429_length_10330_cov_4.369759_1_plen_39_part_00